MFFDRKLDILLPNFLSPEASKLEHRKRFLEALKSLKLKPGTRWLVTGCAGFIGSHVIEELLGLEQSVVGLDNFATGKPANLEAVASIRGEAFKKNFHFIEGDIRDEATCIKACEGVDQIIHLAALGSVPRSIARPADSIGVNINGFLNVLNAAREMKVPRTVFASSSSVYGDDPSLPKKEGQFGRVLSPYAASKRTNELLGEAFSNCYGMELIGLRFFNVFGERQNADGPYAAVIPKWTRSMLGDGECFIHGDGLTSRDFTYVKNVVLALLLASITKEKEAFGRTLNTACGGTTSLNELFDHLRSAIGQAHPPALKVQPKYQDFRAGDIRHSIADIHQAEKYLGYKPLYSVSEGLELCVPDFLKTYG